MLVLREPIKACALRASCVVANEGIGFSTVAILLPLLVEAFVFPIGRLNLLLQLAQRAHGLFQEQGATRVCGAAILGRDRLGLLVFRVCWLLGKAILYATSQRLPVCLREVCRR